MKSCIYSVVILISLSSCVWAAKSDFIPLVGAWDFDKTINLPAASQARCSLIFTNRKFNLEKELEDAADLIKGLTGKAGMALICQKNEFIVPDDKINADNIVLSFTKPYPANSSPSFTNRGKSKSIRGAEIIGFVTNVSEDNDTMQGLLTVRNDDVDVFEEAFTATRKSFVDGSKLRLFNFIKSSAGEKTKLIAGNTADFVAGVRSFGKIAMADDEVITTIVLPTGVSTSDVTVLSNVEEDGLDCSTISELGLTQLVCKAKALGPSRSLAKVSFRVKIPQDVDDIDIVVDSDLSQEDKFKRIQLNSRPARLSSKVGAAQRGKVACVVKGSTPLKKISGFTSDLSAGEGTAIISSIRVLDNNKFVFHIGGTIGKRTSTLLSMSGTMAGLPSSSTLLEGETHNFTSSDVRLSVSKDTFSSNPATNDLDLGGNTGTGPFNGLIKLEPSTGVDNQGRTTVSGQFQIKVTGAVFTKVRGSQTREKTIPENTITCRFKDLRTICFLRDKDTFEL